LLLALVSVATPRAHAQTPVQEKAGHATQRLYLKDGSFQLVTEYHLQGDHVHYYSAERAAWEDVPMTLVDLEATQKWNRERDQLVEKERAARAAEHAAAEASIQHEMDEKQPEVATKLRLPSTGYFWGLDVFDGKPNLIPLAQPEAEAQAREKAREEFAGQAAQEKKEKKKVTAADEAKAEATAKAYEANAANQPPMSPKAEKAGRREELHLSGTQSRRSFHVTLPVLFLREGSLPAPKFVLIRMLVDFQHQDRRMSPPSVEALAGGSGKGFAAVTVTNMPGGKWLKITMPTDLPIGQYALVRILGPDTWDEHVWDFAVNPEAPQNGEAVLQEN
jgi:hypothetical protein